MSRVEHEVVLIVFFPSICFRRRCILLPNDVRLCRCSTFPRTNRWSKL